MLEPKLIQIFKQSIHTAITKLVKGCH